MFLIDPVDPTSLYPELLALKRQCIIHEKPFLCTGASAHCWLAVEITLQGGWIHTQWRPSPSSLGNTTIALIAHDALKERMVAFATEHFDFLSRFGQRIATGTTGGLLNQLARQIKGPHTDEWVRPLRSGPLGGDAQIAEWVLDGRCQYVVFFEDPHVARQHEADIQLLDRAVCAMTNDVVIWHGERMASRWAQAQMFRSPFFPHHVAPT